MKREEIIKLARKAGLYETLECHVPGKVDFEEARDELERFAALVAAAEREACAKTAEGFLMPNRNPIGLVVADAIRARGQA